MARSNRIVASSPDSATPLLHRIALAGAMRYFLIGSWGLALATTTPWRSALIWFIATTAVGLFRTVIDGTSDHGNPATHARLKLVMATVSCAFWSIAPLMSFFYGGSYSLTVAVALLISGYTLVFTQMRAEPREAIIVSSPYSVAVVVLIAYLAQTSDVLAILALIPVVGLALVTKVVVTELKDRQLEAVNTRQAVLIEDLASARDRANAANDAKSNFLGVVSHELRTPLNGVLGAAQLLDMTSLEPAQQSYVSIIRRSGESLLTQLNDILDLTKIEAGHLSLDLVETPTCDLTDRMIGPFQVHAESKGLTFVLTELGNRPDVVIVDPLRLAQITHNLLSNAVKFTDEGRVGLEIRHERLSDTRARLTLSVHDSGTGIAEDDLDQLFQPFSQVDASSTRRFGGTGLGLSISRSLAHLMDGDVRVLSALGVGSTFSLEVEFEVVAWVVESQRSDETNGLALDQGPLNVLIVEDHPVNRMILESWLRSLGHACYIAENGRVACELANTTAFDLIVMDVNMPVMDGLSATREIRSTPGPNQNAPIAVLSASARPEDHALGYEAGADSYVDKPVDFVALALVLAAAPLGRLHVQSLQPQRVAA